MPKSPVDALSPALNLTKRQLFQPFRLGRWARLALICMLTGEFTGGGGGGGSFNVPSGGSSSSEELLAVGFSHIGWLVPVAIFALVAVGLVWIYVASVFRFVLFDSVLHDRCELGEGWGRYQSQGSRLFVWWLVYLFLVLMGLAVIVGVPVGLVWQAGIFGEAADHLALLILGGLAVLALCFVWVMLGILIVFLTKDFVVPLMALEGLTVTRAWGRLWPMLLTDKSGYLLYALLKMVLVLGAAIVMSIINLFIFLILALPLVLAGAVGVIVGQEAGIGLSPALIAALALLGGVLLVVLLYVIAFIHTPAMVFFQAYAIHFFGSRYPRLGDILSPPPSSPPISPAPAST